MRILSIALLLLFLGGCVGERSPERGLRLKAQFDDSIIVIVDDINFGLRHKTKFFAEIFVEGKNLVIESQGHKRIIPIVDHGTMIIEYKQFIFFEYRTYLQVELRHVDDV